MTDTAASMEKMRETATDTESSIDRLQNAMDEVSEFAQTIESITCLLYTSSGVFPVFHKNGDRPDYAKEDVHYTPLPTHSATAHNFWDCSIQ